MLIEFKQGKGNITVTSKDNKTGVETPISNVDEAAGNVKGYDAPVAHVSFKGKVTRNMGNYNSVSIEVGVVMPAELVEMEQVFDYAVGWVEDRLNAKVAEVEQAAGI